MNKQRAPLLLITLVTAALVGAVCIYLLLTDLRAPDADRGNGPQNPAALSPFGVAPAKPASP